MEQSKIKGLFKSYNMICAEIHQLNQEIIELTEVTASHRELSAIVYSDAPRSGKIADPTYEKAQKIIDIYLHQVEKVEAVIAGLFEKKNEIEALFETLDDAEHQIMKLRYQKKYNWEMISNVVNYSRRQCINIHDKVIERLEQEN